MWFQLNTTFSTHLGALSTLQSNYGVTYSLSNFTKTTAPDMVKKNDPLTVVLTITEGATFSTASMTDGTNTVTGSLSGSTVTMTLSSVKGPVTVIARATSVNGDDGEEEEPIVPTPGETTTLTPHSTKAGFYIDSSSVFQTESSSSVVIYAVQPNTAYSFSVEKKSTGSSSNANLIFVPVKSLSGVTAGGSPDFATGYSARVVEMSTNETNVLDYAFTTPADCNYIIFSNHKSGSTYTVTTNASGSSTPEVEGTDVALTKAVDGVYLGPTAKYTSDGTSQVLCYAVSPNKTYTIGAPLDSSKKLVVCCVKSIDNIAAGNTATFATGWSDRQIGEAGANLTITTPADCTHLVFSNYLQNQAPTYVKLVN